MPDPRTIALQKNERSSFGPEPDPDANNPLPVEPDYAANATNPPDPAPPLKITNNG